jgi:cyclase
MLSSRIIPCLLIQGDGLVKTRRFAEPKYVGDPINAVRIFNEKEVDELIVIDIDATRLSREPDYAMIAKLANECRMPLCYGGGVRNEAQVERIISSGVEKVSISAAAIADPGLIDRSARRVGSQSIVFTLDAQKTGLLRAQEVVTHNASVRTGRRPVETAREMQDRGAGEILLNMVDRDGMMSGYDLDLVAQIRAAISVPLTVLGGAGSHDDIAALIRQEHIIGAAAGSLFVFKGKYRAVLISYPNAAEKQAIFASAGNSS